MSAGLHFHPLRVAAVRPDGVDARVVTFEVDAASEPLFRHEPGQYLTLRAVVDGTELRRSYSICSGPGEPLRVGVRRVPGGACSGWLHERLRPGDTVDAMPPQGRFGAGLAGAPRHVLAVAGGSGITPILAIVKAVLARDGRSRATLVYGNRSVATTMFADEIADLKDRHLARLAVHPVWSRESVGSPLQSGRVDAGKLAQLLRLAGPVDEAFVCGPHAMNDEVEAALADLGLPRPRIHVERFGVPPSAADATLHASRPGDATRARIAIVRDGVTREVDFRPDDDSLLAAAARSGLDVPYSCRSGVCATCRAKVTEGRVRMDRNFALDADEVAAGFVLTCQAHPLSDRVAVSFDER